MGMNENVIMCQSVDRERLKEIDNAVYLNMFYFYVPSIKSINNISTIQFDRYQKYG